MASNQFSPFALLSQPLDQIRSHLVQYGAELKETKFAGTYIIKFSPQTQAYHPSVNQLRGIVFRQSESGTPYLYAVGFPVPIEYKDQTPESQCEIQSSLKKTTYTVQEALDGTLIRLWYHDETGQWMIATNSKEDAHDAYWMNNVSFGALFEATLQGILTNLNPNHVYLFSLCHPLNVIVVNHVVPKIYHLTTIDRVTLMEVEIDLGIPHPPTFEMTVDGVLEQIQASQSTPVSSAGYTIVPVPNEFDVVCRYRFENLNYTRARALRGDCNNIETIILSHLLRRTDSDSDVPIEDVGFANGAKHQGPAKLSEFLQYYPIYQQTYCSILKRLNGLISYIYQVYVQRYKYHKEIWTDPRHHHFLQEVHRQLYLSHLRPQGKSVTEADVVNFIYNQEPNKISYLIEIL